MSAVTMRVDQLLSGEALGLTRTVDRTPTGPSFASALQGVAQPTSSAAARSLANETPQRAGAATAGKAPAGEKTRPVEGKEYVEIISGPRNGMFINRSGNSRDGEAFVRVEKDGRDVHVYGTGKNRESVVVWHSAEEQRERAATVPAGEKSSPVEGKYYDEIIEGPRNGMFINRSGNVRDGLAFVLVKHAHREDHIYFTGRHQQIIEVWDAGYGPKAEAAKRDAAAGTTATGETAAPGGTAAAGDGDGAGSTS